MTVDLLSQEDCTKILQNRFNRKDIKVISHELKPISENMEGFLGEHYNLLITYEMDNKTNTEIFFFKTRPTKLDLQIEMCKEYKAYKKEIFIYDILIKEFDKYGYDTSFAAKSFYCIPEQSLILENMVHKGFELSEKQTMFDLNKIKCTLKALALYHGAGFAYEKSKTKEIENFSFEREYVEFMEEFFFVFYINPTHFSMNWWNNSFKTLNRIIDLLPEEESYKMEFKNMVNRFPFGKSFSEKTKLAKTCGHGDLWSNNMLFKYVNESAVECCLLDFQICRYFYPCFDVLLAIFVNTSAEFRKDNLIELYQYYYKILSDTLKNYGHSIENILPLDDFYESIRLTKADAMLQVISAIFILYLPQEMFTNLMKDNKEDAARKIMLENTNLCCDAFTNDDRYRKIVSNSLQDLRSAILGLE